MKAPNILNDKERIKHSITILLLPCNVMIHNTLVWLATYYIALL